MKNLQQFSQYCEKIRSIHRETDTQQLEDDDHTEILYDNIEEYDVVEQECENQVELLAIETDVDADECDTVMRRHTCKQIIFNRTI